MPLYFIGHGSPMNAIADNSFTQFLKNLRYQLPQKPKAILVVSAHWETNGSRLLANQKPNLIYDFSGFPEELYQIQYSPPGDLELVRQIKASLDDSALMLDAGWGLDHGAWSLLVHAFPQADIPVFQLSLDRGKTFQQHFDLARELSFLRKEGVLVIGSGNIVHNLRRINWMEAAPPFSWAREFDQVVQQALSQRDFQKLISFDSDSSELRQQAVPTPEHFLPLIYIAGMSDIQDQCDFPFEGFQNASISMRAVKFAPKSITHAQTH